LEKFNKYSRIILELSKVKITSFVALSTTVGFILFNEAFTFQMILPTFGVFLLACGSSAINHVQESEYDALMERTKYRPIPSGRINKNFALFIALIIVTAGSIVLFTSSNLLALLLGWTALAWYNFIYTPLKKKFALAVIPGSLIGAIPPIIGWTAAGGSPFHIQILTIGLFFFIWQIPHFWLLLLIHSNDYEKAGYPTLNQKFNQKQISKYTFIWIAILTISCLLIPIFNVSSNIFSSLLIILFGVFLLLTTKDILTQYIEKVIIRKAFIMVNLYVLAVSFVISIDKLLLRDI
jgi:protoheme IX farnesyltransferase